MKYFSYSSVFILLVTTLVLVAPDVAWGGILAPKAETRSASGDNDEVRDLIEDTFGDDHVMVDVARCESSFRQFNVNGDVLVNQESGAIGIYQLLESYHLEPAEDRGLNIYSAEGNVEYAKILYEADGLKPWSPSSLCWDNGEIAETNADYEPESSSRNRVIVRSEDDDDTEDDSKEVESDTEEDESSNGSDDIEANDTNDSSDSDTDRIILGRDNTSDESPVEVEEVITKRLIIGVHDPQVIELQKLLNSIGYELTDDGPGSPGEETNYFGSLTKAALQEFQCDKDIICEGAEYTTGYGMTNTETRQALNVSAAGIPASSNRVPIRVRSDQPSSRNSTEEQDTSSTTELEERIQALQDQIANLRSQLNQ